MYAIVNVGGKQYKVSEGDEIYVEKLGLDAGEAIDLQVLMVDRDGSLDFDGGAVKGKIIKNGKQKKITVFKFKPKKNYKRKQGHRQPYTKLLIESIK